MCQNVESIDMSHMLSCGDKSVTEHGKKNLRKGSLENLVISSTNQLVIYHPSITTLNVVKGALPTQTWQFTMIYFPL